MRLASVILSLAAHVAFGQVTVDGNVIIVSDPSGSIHNRVLTFTLPGLIPAGGLFCQDAAKATLAAKADEYDMFVTFGSENIPGSANTPLAQQVRVSVQNIAQNPLYNDGASFGSAAKLKHCAYMGSLRRMPADPDALAGDIGSGMTGLRAIEAVAHEVGHYWLMHADYNEGFGTNTGLRAMDTSHYDTRVNSESVMFGNCITDLGGGDFRLAGCVRKYNALDQYFMGLRAPTEVPPILQVTGTAGTDPYYPLPVGASQTISGARREITIESIIREMGARSPTSATAQKCFRIGFVYVAKTPATPADVAKVDTYRRRFQEWFTVATDGRGFVDTRALGTGCIIPDRDAGVPDAGAEVDAGVVDAGAEVDAGVPDAGISEVVDAGPEEDGGVSMDVGNKMLKPVGCTCSQVDVSALLLGLVVLRRRRSR